MKKDIIEILVTFDKNYINPFKTMLKSMIINNPDEIIRIWLLHSEIPHEELEKLKEYCSLQGVTLMPIQVNRNIFKNAPISKQYPQEMYYRLLAPNLLPDSLDKIIYLDPDILIINSLKQLWNLELKDYIFAAASHIGVIDIMNGVNKIRLGKEHVYFNTGVMLMDLSKARKIVKKEEIFECVEENASKLILPDQDVFNYLYGKYTLQIDDAIWNYDVRYYSEYLIRNKGISDIDWIMINTVILHFCGKKKPWKKIFSNKFSVLYKHYMRLAFK